jgi:kojibiose phosphorylase
MLTGPGYKGHVFWDTEIYMLPFYIFTHPPSARALLMYRYHTLDGAREKARQMGYRGAMYAWESADTGAETTPPYVVLPSGAIMPVLSGTQEHHISADVPYAVWQYWQATGDDGFLLQAGAEIVLETARFWASRVELGEDARYHIRRIVGPDEYHENVEDNAYTNGMAQWALECGVETATLLAQRWPAQWRALRRRLELRQDELQRWSSVAREMYTGLDPHTGLFEQFRGFHALEPIDLTQYAGRQVPMDVILGHARTQQVQIVKQADVLMLIYLLWERFTPAIRSANFLYYEPRTAHGSSLSPSIHALIAARLGDTATAMRYFHQAAAIDLGNNMGNASAGVHAAALGGLWQAIVFGFAGLAIGHDMIAFDPHLPAAWEALRFSLQFRGQSLCVSMQDAAVEISAEGSRPLAVRVGGAPAAALEAGRAARWERSAGQQTWRERRT